MNKENSLFVGETSNEIGQLITDLLDWVEEEENFNSSKDATENDHVYMKKGHQHSYRKATKLERNDSNEANDKEESYFSDILNGKNDSKRGPPCAVSPKCIQPLLNGWRRELVHRQPVGEDNISRTQDVYYFAPDGIKLRSYREVESYLIRIEETRFDKDCFSFRKILFYHPPEEIEREAGKPGLGNRLGRNFKKPFKIKSTDILRTKNKIKLKKEFSKGKTITTGTKTAQKLLAKTLKSAVVNKINNPMKSETVNKLKHPITTNVQRKTVPCSLSCSGQNGILPSLQCSACLCMFHPQCVGFQPNKTSFVCFKCISGCKSTSNNKRNMKENSADVTPNSKKPFHQLQKSSVPIKIDIKSEPVTEKESQPKVIEMTPVFNALPRLTAAPERKANNDANKVSVQIANRPLPPLKAAPHIAQNRMIKPVKTLGTWMPPSTLPPKTLPLPRQPPPLRMATFHSLLKKEQDSQGNTVCVIHRPPPPLLYRAQTPVMNPIVVSNQNVLTPTSLIVFPNATKTPDVNAVQGTTVTSAASSSTPVISTPVSTPGLVTMTENTAKLATIDTTKFVLETSAGTLTEVQVPKISMTSSLPPQPKFIVVNKEEEPTGLMVEFGGNMIHMPILNYSVKKYSLAVGKVITISDGSENTSSSESVNGQAVLDVNKEHNKNNKWSDAIVDKSGGESRILSDGKDPSENQTSNESLQTSPESVKSAKQRKPGVNPALCSIERLFAGAKVLLKVFEYLRPDELSRVRCVCQTWSWLASQPDLWKCIRLNGICVHDWEKLSNIIKKHKSTRLDMRKMEMFEDRNRTWHGFAACLQELETIEHIDFGHVPISVLHTAASNLSQLRVLTAEWITEYSASTCRFDIGIFGKLRRLKKLRLRGISGLHLSTYPINRGVPCLQNSDQLTHLSLTSLKDVTGPEFEFIKSLVKLKELELGDCNNWSQETYSYLDSLCQLEKLRLECTPILRDRNVTYFTTELKELRDLELYDCEISEQLMTSLNEMPNLQRLSIWPNTNQSPGLVNTIVLKGLQGLNTLRFLCWGVMNKSIENPDKTFEENIVVIASAFNEDETRIIQQKPRDDYIPFSLSEDEGNRSDDSLTVTQLDRRIRYILPKGTNVFLHSAYDKNSYDLSYLS